MRSPAGLDSGSPANQGASPVATDSPPPLRRNFVGRPLVAVGIAALAGALLLNLKSAKSRKLTLQIPQASATSSRIIRLTGTTEAVRMRAITAPLVAGEHMGTLTITKLAAGGGHVRQGDIVAEFDRQAAMREFIDKQAEYENLADQVLQEQAKEQAARAKDETELRQAESDLSKAELEMQKVELLSRIDAEKAGETLQAAKATLRKLRTSFDLKRQAAHAGIRLLEIQRDRARQIMTHAQANAEFLQIHSPISGVVVLNTIWKQGKLGEVQEGDQVRPGVTFMQVVDPSRMEVRAFVNQEDFLSLQFGEPAEIHLDAYPDLAFPGKLEEMAPIARPGDFSSKLRSFTVVFSIAGTNAKLMPDLSAAVDVNVAPQNSGAGAFH